MAMKYQNPKRKGAASKIECARHYVAEHQAKIDRLKEDESYIEGTPAYDKDQAWLETLIKRAGLDKQTNGKTNPIKASKRK